MVGVLTKLSVVFALLLCAVLQAHQAETASNRTSVLKLLLVLNLQQGPMEQWVPSWDRGHEILPLAQQAIDSINRDPSILPGYNLELVNVDSGFCTPNFHTEALLNFVHQVNQPDQHIAGVVGLFCTGVAQLLSPLAAHSGLNLLQISGSASPVLFNQDAYPYLWHMVPSSTVYIDTTFRLMEQYEWSRIAVIGDERIRGDVYHFHTVEAFFLKAATYSNSSQSLETTLIVSGPQFIKRLRISGHKIIFASVTLKTAVEILCLAYIEDMIWPHYAWIFYDHQIDDFKVYSGAFCGLDSLMHALEGVFLLQHEYSQTESSRNQWNYNQEYQTPFSNNSYAMVLYDTLRAVALAMNNVDINLYLRNMSLVNKLLGNQESFTQMVNFELMYSSKTFSRFRNNIELHTVVSIYQIKHETAEKIGSYDLLSGQTLFNRNLSASVPTDEIPRIYRFLPIAAVVFLSIVTGMCIILTTVILFLFVYYRNAAEIKATSPKLSLFMFVGSYLLLGSTVALIFISAVVNEGPLVCSACSWSASLGINFIFATLLVRILRVYRVFTYFGKLGRRWSDRVLCVIMLSIVGVEAVILLVWTAADAFTIEDVEIYQVSTAQPYYEVAQFCSSRSLRTWLTLVFSEIGVVMLFVALLAYKTRKIRRKHFKDTKKVNTYIFTSILLICVSITQWWVLRTNNYPAASLVTVFVNFGGNAVLCQILLFVPKVMPPLVRHLFRSKYGLEKSIPTCSYQYSQDNLTQKSYINM